MKIPRTTAAFVLAASLMPGASFPRAAERDARSSDDTPKTAIADATAAARTAAKKPTAKAALLPLYS